MLWQEYYQENAARSIQAWFRGQTLRIRLEVLDDLAVRLFVPGGDADDPIEVSDVDEDFEGTVAQPIDVDLEISFAYDAGGEFYPDDLGEFSPHEEDFIPFDIDSDETWTPPSITESEDYDEDDSDF